MSTAEALVDCIATQPQVLRAVCVFNQNPADYIDESRHGEFFAQPIAHDVWQSPRARRHLSRHILERMESGPCLEPQRPEWPVALLERPRLDRLALHVAGALVGQRARRCISRDEVMAWREWLTPEVHDFALTRAGLMPVKAEAAQAQAQPRGEGTALELGHNWIVAASRRWPQAIAQLFMLKLPAGEFRAASTVDAVLAGRLVSSVLSIVEPRWCSSFATTPA